VSAPTVSLGSAARRRGTLDDEETIMTATTDPTTGPPPADCGDNNIDDGEECDDGPANADDANAWTKLVDFRSYEIDAHDRTPSQQGADPSA